MIAKADLKGRNSSVFREALKTIEKNYETDDQEEQLTIYADVSHQMTEAKGD